MMKGGFEGEKTFDLGFLIENTESNSFYADKVVGSSPTRGARKIAILNYSDFLYTYRLTVERGC